MLVELIEVITSPDTANEKIEELKTKYSVPSLITADEFTALLHTALDLSVDNGIDSLNVLKNILDTFYTMTPAEYSEIGKCFNSHSFHDELPKKVATTLKKYAIEYLRRITNPTDDNLRSLSSIYKDYALVLDKAENKVKVYQSALNLLNKIKDVSLTEEDHSEFCSIILCLANYKHDAPNLWDNNLVTLFIQHFLLLTKVPEFCTKNQLLNGLFELYCTGEHSRPCFHHTFEPTFFFLEKSSDNRIDMKMWSNFKTICTLHNTPSHPGYKKEDFLMYLKLLEKCAEFDLIPNPFFKKMLTKEATKRWLREMRENWGMAVAVELMENRLQPQPTSSQTSSGGLFAFRIIPVVNQQDHSHQHYCHH